MTDITELEEELLIDLRKQRLENIKEVERLPEGIDKDKFFVKIKHYSKYKDYIVLGEEAEKLATTRKFVINKGRVTTDKKLESNWLSGSTVADRKKEQKEFMKRVELGLSIMQRDMQVAFAKELDDYLDSNPSVKIANAFFVDFESLRWSTATLFDDDMYEAILCCSFLLRFNMYID